MEKLLHRIDQEKVRESIDRCIENKGYPVDRTFTIERFGLPRKEDVMFPYAMAASQLSYGLSINRILEENFAPIKEIYQEGRELFTKALVLSSRYKQLSDEYAQGDKKREESFENVRKSYLEEMINAGAIKKFLVERKIKRLDKQIRFLEGIKNKYNFLPKRISEEESRVSLNKLCSWLQIGDEDEDSKKALDEIIHPFEVLSDRQVELIRIRSELYKIKNYTAIVCLKQLDNEGLTLPNEVLSELKRIPKNYLQEVHSKSSDFALRSSDKKFGDGLY